MKIATIIIRILFGLLLLISSVLVLFKLAPQPELQGTMKVFNDGVQASGYLMTLIKVTELFVAIAFLVNRFVPLATIVMFPISVNIFFVHTLLAPEGMPMAIFVLAANIFLAYVHKASYAPLLKAK